MFLLQQFGAMAQGLAGLAMVLGLLSALLSLRLRAAEKQCELAFKIAQEHKVTLEEMRQHNRLAEEVAAIGLWQYDPADSKQVWSRGLRGMFGVAPEEGFLPGDAETLLASNGVDLVSMVMAKRDARDPFSLRFTILKLEGTMRVLSMRVSHIRDDEGKLQKVVGVVVDVTEQAEREKQLEKTRDLALREAHKARELANTDPLTGLSNRRRVMNEMDRLIIRAKKREEAFAVLTVDVDHFKQVNDQHGHPVGDKVLKHIGKLLAAQARNGDVVGRIGGEEFIWLANDADNSIARILAERLRQQIEAPASNNEIPRVTVSIGFASLRPDDSALTLFARADQALYDAKEAGRNMVRMAA